MQGLKKFESQLLIPLLGLGHVQKNRERADFFDTIDPNLRWEWNEIHIKIKTHRHNEIEIQLTNINVEIVYMQNERN